MKITDCRLCGISNDQIFIVESSSVTIKNVLKFSIALSYKKLHTKFHHTNEILQTKISEQKLSKKSYFDAYFSHKEPLGYRINYLYCIYQTVQAEFMILGNRFIHIQFVPIHKCFEKYCGSKYINTNYILQAMIPCSLRTAFTSALNTKCLRIY